MWNDSPGKSYHRIKSSAWLRRVVILLPYHPCGWIRDFVVESSCQGFGEWAKTVGNLGWPDIDGGSSLGSDPWLRNGCKSLIQQMNDIQGWHGYNQGLCFWTFWLACFRKVIAPAMRTGDVSFLQKLGQKFCKTSFQSFFSLKSLFPVSHSVLLLFTFHNWKAVATLLLISSHLKLRGCTEGTLILTDLPQGLTKLFVRRDAACFQIILPWTQRSRGNAIWLNQSTSGYFRDVAAGGHFWRRLRDLEHLY